METRSLRFLLTANMAVFLAVCVAFLLHHLGAGLFPEGVESWFERNQWVMWTAVALTLASASAIPLLNLREHR